MAAVSTGWWLAPIAIARAKSIAAAQQALREQRQVGILLQRNPDVDDPGPNDDVHFRLLSPLFQSESTALP